MSALLSCNNFTVYLAPIQIGPWANAAIRSGATKVGGRAQKGMSAFPPKAEHVQRTSPCPLCANSGLMQCSNWDRYSFTPSTSANSDSRTVTRGRLRREPAVAKHRLVAAALIYLNAEINEFVHHSYSSVCVMARTRLASAGRRSPCPARGRFISVRFWRSHGHHTKVCKHSSPLSCVKSMPPAHHRYSMLAGGNGDLRPAWAALGRTALLSIATAEAASTATREQEIKRWRR